MQNKIGYHTCLDEGGKHSQVYEEIAITNMGEETVEASVVQIVTTYDHATDTVTSGNIVPEVEEAEEQAEEQSEEIPQEDVEEPEEPAEEQAEEPAEEQEEEQVKEQAEEMPQEDVEEAEEQPAEAGEVEE